MAHTENLDIQDFFVNRIIQLRLQKGVSARDMSLSLGQNSSYIRGIEAKRNFPSMSIFFDICDYFGITPMEFFDTENRNPLKTSELIRISRSLNSDLIEHLIAITEVLAKNQNKGENT